MALSHRWRSVPTACDNPTVESVRTREDVVDPAAADSVISMLLTAAAASKNSTGTTATRGSNHPPVSIASILATRPGREKAKLRPTAMRLIDVGLALASPATPRK